MISGIGIVASKKLDVSLIFCGEEWRGKTIGKGGEAKFL